MSSESRNSWNLCVRANRICFTIKNSRNFVFRLKYVHGHHNFTFPIHAASNSFLNKIHSFLWPIKNKGSTLNSKLRELLRPRAFVWITGVYNRNLLKQGFQGIWSHWWIQYCVSTYIILFPNIARWDCLAEMNSKEIIFRADSI